MNIIQEKLDEHMDYIKSCYAEPHRHYHTWQHIEEMLAPLNRGINRFPEDPDGYEILLGVYFHDIVYDPKSSTNEEDSSKIFKKLFKEVLSKQQLKRISTAILDTKTHSYKPENKISHALCLLDLGIFTKPFARLMEFEDQIRKEYSWVPKDIYLVERRKVLERFHARPEQIEYMFHTIGKE